MPWLYLLILSIVILGVWWALSRSSVTTEITGSKDTTGPAGQEQKEHPDDLQAEPPENHPDESHPSEPDNPVQ